VERQWLTIDATDMQHYAAASRRRLATPLGGDLGNALRQRADR
jgi:hypothetical protein